MLRDNSNDKAESAACFIVFVFVKFINIKAIGLFSMLYKQSRLPFIFLPFDVAAAAGILLGCHFPAFQHGIQGGPEVFAGERPA
jgi:hypothetical protein